ncbi:SUSHI domain-containing protein [Cryptosporidium muris RN66]|uniref:SUSHI domain-containing protein n=1 Tax=Cryptosporidium muris (strain RN66) TaxID=441375 RepID=B6AB94_CRYMR|nr:SUSHI domain-containing protein [Cryptosporidium muris RN66]EEA05646.1 SUSHI domain-containing protein [Cryptosporidium muris RN66]|eukprot:XP_002139995.1 SUSHI domain-containing protein [Cryptosporidium muris RN66]
MNLIIVFIGLIGIFGGLLEIFKIANASEVSNSEIKLADSALDEFTQKEFRDIMNKIKEKDREDDSDEEESYDEGFKEEDEEILKDKSNLSETESELDSLKKKQANLIKRSKAEREKLEEDIEDDIEYKFKELQKKNMKNNFYNNKNKGIDGSENRERKLELEEYIEPIIDDIDDDNSQSNEDMNKERVDDDDDSDREIEEKNIRQKKEKVLDQEENEIEDIKEDIENSIDAIEKNQLDFPTNIAQESKAENTTQTNIKTLPSVGEHILTSTTTQIVTAVLIQSSLKPNAALTSSNIISPSFGIISSPNSSNIKTEAKENKISVPIISQNSQSILNKESTNPPTFILLEPNLLNANKIVTEEVKMTQNKHNNEVPKQIENKGSSQEQKVTQKLKDKEEIVKITEYNKNLGNNSVDTGTPPKLTSNSGISASLSNGTNIQVPITTKVDNTDKDTTKEVRIKNNLLGSGETVLSTINSVQHVDNRNNTETANEKLIRQLTELVSSAAFELDSNNEKSKNDSKVFLNLNKVGLNNQSKEDKVELGKEGNFPEIIQKHKRWYEKRDPVTGQLLFDAAQFAKNISSTLNIRRTKGRFSTCIEYNGKREACEKEIGCFYDSVYDMCLINCGLIKEKNTCEEYLECRYDYIIPRKACVNDCFQSRNFTHQDFEGIIRGCVWCTQESTCLALAKVQKEKYPEPKDRMFDCHWQLQSGLKEDINGEFETSICVDKNLGRKMTDKDLMAASYITGQVKVMEQAVENIAQNMLKEGIPGEETILKLQDPSLLKKKICTPRHIPFLKIIPNKPFYLEGEMVTVKCEPGYSITGSTNEIICEDGELIPQVYCIAHVAIQKQASSIRKHLDNIFSLLINSVTGGSEWLGRTMEELHKKQEMRGNSELEENKFDDSKDKEDITKDNNMETQEGTTKAEDNKESPNIINKLSEPIKQNNEVIIRPHLDTNIKEIENDKQQSDNETTLNKIKPSDSSGNLMVFDRVTGKPILTTTPKQQIENQIEKKEQEKKTSEDKTM